MMYATLLYAYYAYARGRMGTIVRARSTDVFSHTIRRIVNEGTLSPPRRAGPPSDVITTI